MRILLLCAITFFLGFTQVNAQTSFHLGTYDDLKREAKRENKPYFVVFQASWCQPCKQMEKEVFADYEVGKYVNANYLAFKLDGEKEPYKYLTKEYWVTAYPTIIIFDKEGEEKSRIDGYRDVDAFLDELQSNKPGVFKTKFSDFR